jgi:hypothetical protein
MNIETRNRLAEVLQPIVGRTGLRAYARSVEVSPSAVTKWLHCENFPDDSSRERVALSLGMTIEQFNAEIIRGSEAPDSRLTLEQNIAWIRTASKSELAIVLRIVAEQLEAV